MKVIFLPVGRLSNLANYQYPTFADKGTESIGRKFVKEDSSAVFQEIDRCRCLLRQL